MTSLKNIIKKILPLILLFVLSLFVVFYQFLNIPKNTTFDEIEFAKLALLLGKEPYTPYSFYATGHATLYFYILLLSFKVFGVSLFALRLPAAVFGIINPMIFYLVLRKIFKNPLPVILAVVFISLRWYFNFARFGFEVTFLLFLELMSLYFILVFLEKKKLTSLALSGVFAGFAYNSYQPGRVFFIIPLFLLGIALYKFIAPVKTIRSRIAHFKPLLYFLIPFFVLILPLTIYLNLHKDTRFYQQFYPDNHEMTLQAKEEYFLQNLSSTLGIFNIKGDVNGRHNYPNKPALNPILRILFLAGLMIAVFKIKERNNQMFLLWMFLSLAPTLVTYPWENPNMLRTFTVIPSVIYFVGLTIQKTIDLAFIKNKKWKYLMILFFVGIIMLSSLYEVRTYFIHQAQVFKEAFEAQHPLEYYIQK